MKSDDSELKLNNGSGKTDAAKVAMVVAFMLAVSKASVGFMTGSLAVLSSAVDSILDIIASFFNYVAIKKAEEPADDEHEFGHGKYEALATFIQSLIILGTGVFILVSAVKKFMNGTHEETGSITIYVMILSIVATVFLTIYLRRKAKSENSTVLEADSMHYAIDLYTNVGILIALVVIKFTGWHFVDPLVAGIVAVYIMISAVKLSIKVSKVLLDNKIDQATHDRLVDVLNRFGEYHKDYHQLRTRSAGHQQFVDMHMTFCQDLKLAEVHTLIDEVEEAIKKEIPEADITIHPEPCRHVGCEAHREDCNSLRVRAALDTLKKRDEAHLS